MSIRKYAPYEHQTVSISVIIHGDSMLNTYFASALVRIAAKLNLDGIFKMMSVPSATSSQMKSYQILRCQWWSGDNFSIQ